MFYTLGRWTAMDDPKLLSRLFCELVRKITSAALSTEYGNAETNRNFSNWYCTTELVANYIAQAVASIVVGWKRWKKTQANVEVNSKISPSLFDG